ncbi:GtrA family protein [Sphingomonas sp. MMS24-J45]|uniref:GtrA family protein n=1 Tax=Sphingomonas sp. MMS24-J45 TaxID=3238806 RepID=UPI00384DAFE5
MTAFHRQMEQMRASGMLGEVLRFGISGGITTLIYIAVYWPLTHYVFEQRHAVYAVPFAFAVAVTAGFFLHSRWSFKGHETRDPDPLRHVKFVAVQASGVALNGLITWIGTAKLGYAPMVPLLPAVACATVFTFFLNRQLVFK